MEDNVGKEETGSVEGREELNEVENVVRKPK